MSDVSSHLIREVPLADLLGSGGYERLRYDIQRMAREFGYHQMTLAAQSFGQPMVVVRFELRQPWEPS